ncbi:MAG: virulence protein [Eubacteriales bacterium]
MEVRFNLNGAERKKLVRVMGEILEVKPKYLAMPTTNFMVDYFLVDKEGTVSFPDDSNREDKVNCRQAREGTLGYVEYLFEYLAEEGYLPSDGAFELPELETEVLLEEQEVEEPEDFAVGLVIELPQEQFTEKSLLNLQNLLQAKGTLIKKALGVPDLPIVVDKVNCEAREGSLGCEEKVYFPWFPFGVTEEQLSTDCMFITLICQMAQYQKRIRVKERLVTNEKYTFRCFLLRLGFIGESCKTEGQILLQNFHGSSAFRGREYLLKLYKGTEIFCTFTAPTPTKAEEIALQLAQENESEYCELSEVV